MSLIKLGTLSASLIALTAGHACLAQTFNNPTYYVWGEYPAYGNYTNFSHPYMMRIMHMILSDNQLTAHGWITPTSDPEGAPPTRWPTRSSTRSPRAD